MKKLLISALLTSLLAACASQKPAVVENQPAPIVEPPKAVEVVPAPAPAVPAAPAPAPVIAIDPLNDPHSILAKRSVYYPFDVSVVQDADKPIVEAHAQYLSSHTARKVRLEGNCDERGSDEYNLALGQRRADGVKKMLEAGGVNDSQVEAISYGEEKSRATGHDEASWAQNRRTDLNYGQ
ncbi:MAG: peptidoglycan-associated lipoprotein Pal [Nitrosomonadales bacterium]|nr:peptidoglycan-associated lipoprotein Pal [Nitrosomonadales bacterium]